MSIDRTGSGRADTTRGWCLEVMSTDEIVAYTARHGLLEVNWRLLLQATVTV
jgi:hypothetical protein